MKIRDLFRSQRIQVYPDGNGWVVALLDPDRGAQSVRTYGTLPEALEAIGDWMRVMTDEREIEDDPVIRDRLFDLLHNAMIRYEAGEDPNEVPEDDEKVIEYERLKAWFERQMDGSTGL
jgi:hypothetical protein